MSCPHPIRIQFFQGRWPNYTPGEKIGRVPGARLLWPANIPGRQTHSHIWISTVLRWKIVFCSISAFLHLGVGCCDLQCSPPPTPDHAYWRSHTRHFRASPHFDCHTRVVQDFRDLIISNWEIPDIQICEELSGGSQWYCSVLSVLTNILVNISLQHFNLGKL